MRSRDVTTSERGRLIPALLDFGINKRQEHFVVVTLIRRHPR
jgi:hypothetical protein